MTQSTVTPVDGMHFLAETGSGHSFNIDARPEVGGRDTGCRPVELLMADLVGCTAVDVISIQRKMHRKSPVPKCMSAASGLPSTSRDL